MEARARALVAKQEAVVVPVVAAYLPGKEQKRFNNKVGSTYDWRAEPAVVFIRLALVGLRPCVFQQI